MEPHELASRIPDQPALPASDQNELAIKEELDLTPAQSAKHATRQHIASLKHQVLRLEQLLDANIIELKRLHGIELRYAKLTVSRAWSRFFGGIGIATSTAGTFLIGVCPYGRFPRWFEVGCGVFLVGSILQIGSAIVSSRYRKDE